ncbi:putative bifunctional diguanylate cyclase/phosphodiesterase [Halopseudomonas yangmingensis]|uniref:PAS domain S-box-containing protein/diguanylate cyclase (GGDEF) domain-containing protein n=1 Tax=Halopseudomonas yangmingensis TaxID=1720063 RepID=A0A1I4QRY8_9GAMM|nr:GGDEF domain-containing phosphodiesterase [Halopseudomonas yangmingensis]SFM42828.1 PAS domain S-box-containing protein/diguanylate cyclase (GGDEF) domain-containing protein [Halopseudomonas yangmingensis]
MTSNRSAWHIALIYAAVAGGWILFSDRALVLVGLDELTQQRAQTWKGLLFVLVTACLLYFLSLRHLRSRREQERQLRLSEERLLLALTGANDGVWDWNLENGSAYYSPRCRVLLGLTGPEPLRAEQHFWPHVHPEDQQPLRSELLEHLRGQSERLAIRVRMRHRQGHYLWIELCGQAQRNAEGRALRMIGTARDVTDQVADEERLRQASVVFGSTTEGVMIIDAKVQIVSVNAAFSRITGYTEDEVLGQHPRQFDSTWQDAALLASICRQLETHGSWQGEAWNRRKDGEAYPQWQTVSRVMDAHGQLSHYVVVFADIGQLKRSQQEIDFLAHNDPLTRLPNRLLFRERLDSAIQRARRLHGHLGVIFIDLDRFKGVNESFGHAIGDELLQEVATRLHQRCREQDTLARLGGDEFVMLVEDLQRAEDLTPVARRLLNAFQRPFEIAGQRLHLGASLGISVYPEDGEGDIELLGNADTAVSVAKANGRGTYAFYTHALTERAREMIALESDLHVALHSEQLVVYYQLQRDLRGDFFSGVEALVRWQHPQHGLMAPDRFLPVAQQAGLMPAIDEYVLRHACRQFQTWRASGCALSSLAVNMSGSWLDRGQVVPVVQQVLKETGLPATFLELEITETELMQQDDRCIEVLDSLRALGVRLAIDDFGTGHSSLMRLKRLPVSRLKIDRDFVRGLPGDSNDSAIARAVIALGDSLQLEVLAEGVETAEQEQLLQGFGCGLGQGYLYSRPVPAAELELMQGFL